MPLEATRSPDSGPLERTGIDAAFSGSLDPAAYRTRDWFLREKETIFSAGWVPFAPAQMLERPRSYVAHGLGGWPLLAVRGEDGTLRAFHNVCRHQTLPLSPEGAGDADILHCRFHDWAFDLSGKLVAAPSLRMPTGKRADRLRLGAVEIAVAGPIAYVTLSPEPGALAPVTTGEEAGRPALRVRDVPLNWKSLIESALSRSEWSLHWPTCLIRDLGRERLLRVLVPRSFTRTRIFDLLLSHDDPARSDRRLRSWVEQNAVFESIPAPLDRVRHFTAAIAARMRDG